MLIFMMPLYFALSGLYTDNSLIKMRSLGAPQEALWVDYGLSPQKIAQWKAWAAEEAKNGPLGPPATEAEAPGAMPATDSAATA